MAVLNSDTDWRQIMKNIFCRNFWMNVIFSLNFEQMWLTCIITSVISYFYVLRGVCWNATD